MMNELQNVVDTDNEEELKAYFAHLEREYPELIEAMKAMNISQQQYVIALQALRKQSSYSSSSASLNL